MVVTARLSNRSHASGTAGDGRYVKIYDGQGRTYEPVYAALFEHRRPLGMPTPYDVIWPGETFESGFPYDLPPDSTDLKLVLPFGPVMDVDAVLAGVR